MRPSGKFRERENADAWSFAGWTTGLMAIVFILGACTAFVPLQDTADDPASVSIAQSRATATHELPELSETSTPTVFAIVTTEGSRANVRSGPSMDAPIVAKALPGDSFQVIGKSTDGRWWQVCCVPSLDAEADAGSESAWLSVEVVDIVGDVGAIVEVAAIFSDDFVAHWQVAYRCNSERCAVTECAGEMDAGVRNILQNAWLEIERTVTWPEKCGDDTVARFQVNRYTGQDRYIGEDAAFFDRYWVGANPGEPVKSIPVADGQVVQAWCTGPKSLERQETENWTIVYDGEACYDVQTGMMVTLGYSKSWLFSGVVEERTYERAPGPVEYYDFELDSTNVLLRASN